MLPVASTQSRRFPESYSATWIVTVSAAVVGVAATCEGVALAGKVAVLVGVGRSVEVGVAAAPVAVGKGCVAVGTARAGKRVIKLRLK